MLMPINLTVYNIHIRHHFLKSFIGTKAEEDISMDNGIKVALGFTASVLFCFILEVMFYFLYNRMFHPWIKIVNEANKDKEQILLDAKEDCKKKHMEMETKSNNVSGLPEKLAEVVEAPLASMEEA